MTLRSIELLSENSAGFQMAQNTFNIKWCRHPVALELHILVDSMSSNVFIISLYQHLETVLQLAIYLQ